MTNENQNSLLSEPEEQAEVPAEIPAYEIPEDVKNLLGEQTENLQNILTEMGLAGEKAAAFVQSVTSIVTEIPPKTVTYFPDASNWEKSCVQDPEIGGAAWDKNLNLARKAVSQVGSEKLREFFNETGIGNHPELIRMFVKVGKALGEDTPLMGSKGNVQTAPKTLEDVAILMYGKGA